MDKEIIEEMVDDDDYIDEGIKDSPNRSVNNYNDPRSKNRSLNTISNLSILLADLEETGMDPEKEGT